MWSDAGQLAIAAADVVADEVERSEAMLLGLAGGSTPAATHAELVNRELDWSAVTAWIGDERWVPADDEASNQRMARETLTDRVGAKFLAPDTSMSNPYSSAESYGDELVPRMVDPAVRTVTMLGMGADGHTASLFPNTQALTVDTIAYVANLVPQLDTWRLTATVSMLNASDIVLFVVAGASKAPALAAIANGEPLPAARVNARERTLWYVDEAAAQQLP